MKQRPKPLASSSQDYKRQKLHHEALKSTINSNYSTSSQSDTSSSDSDDDQDKFKKESPDTLPRGSVTQTLQKLNEEAFNWTQVLSFNGMPIQTSIPITFAGSVNEFIRKVNEENPGLGQHDFWARNISLDKLYFRLCCPFGGKSRTQQSKTTNLEKTNTSKKQIKKKEEHITIEKTDVSKKSTRASRSIRCGCKHVITFRRHGGNYIPSTVCSEHTGHTQYEGEILGHLDHKTRQRLAEDSARLQYSFESAQTAAVELAGGYVTRRQVEYIQQKAKAIKADIALQKALEIYGELEPSEELMNAVLDEIEAFNPDSLL